MCAVHGQIVPLIYAAPSAVSHQSRIDIKHSPGFIAGPLIYSPATTLYASHQPGDKPRETVLTPVFTADTILTPVALSFFHNLPLARALEHPISIDKVQEEISQNDAVAEENMEKDDKGVQIAIVTEVPEQGKENTGEKQDIEDKNYVIIAFDDNKQVTSTTDEPNTVGITEA
ncbi:hypothetical protein PYW07_013806 [Mythimna separata]|uniref:Uncharacterized protein n=1 Tax=Mythimna separata TaxID=271217 RepID=A0AAD8DQ73_MYTSE|nr:hypothetical protein PYW07_013806 [Mythimna separata]